MKHKQAFKLKLENKVLVATGFGVWTARDAEEYVAQFRRIVAPIANKPWAIILDVSAWEMSPIEVFALIKDNTQWCYQHNLAMAVSILPRDELLKWQFGKSTEINKPANFISEFSKDVASAMDIIHAAKVLRDD